MRTQVEEASAFSCRNADEGLPWQGCRDFVVDRKIWESEHVCSFYLVPRDGLSLPMYGAGELQSIRLAVPDEHRPAICCYTVSSSPNADFYRITVKRDPTDVASRILHDQIEAGTVLSVEAPQEDFAGIPYYAENRCVFIVKGIGLERFRNLSKAIYEACLSDETILFCSLRNGRDRAIKIELGKLIDRSPNLSAVIAYSTPEATDQLGVDFDIRGDLSITAVKRLLGSNGYKFHICSTPDMTDSLASELRDWGVPQENIFTEAKTDILRQPHFVEWSADPSPEPTDAIKRQPEPPRPAEWLGREFKPQPEETDSSNGRGIVYDALALDSR